MGKKFEKEWICVYVCMCMADSLCCIPETNIVSHLYANKIYIKIKKKVKMKKN